MKRIAVLIVAITSFVSSGVSAQSSRYGLRYPSADAFLSVIPAITNHASTMDYDSISTLVSIISDEAVYRYFSHDDVPTYDRIRTAFSRLRGIAGPRALNSKMWNAALIRAWLRDNKIDLDAAKTLLLDD